MNRKSVEVLISTINQKDLSFVECMNIQTNCVIGNQNGSDRIRYISYGTLKCKLVCSSKKGLARNRNTTIEHSKADICLLADDDITYVDGYEDIIINAFERHRDADVILFNLYEEPIVRYVIKREHRIKGIEFFKYGSVRIAFRRNSIKNKISFDEEFGAGGKIPIGEDTIFLCDCLRSGLKLVAVPEYICKLNPSDSTWFNGYNDAYFINKGKMYYRMFGCWSILFAIQDAYRHRYRYGADRKWIRNVHLMNIGASEYKCCY